MPTGILGGERHGTLAKSLAATSFGSVCLKGR